MLCESHVVVVVVIVLVLVCKQQVRTHLLGHKCVQAAAQDSLYKLYQGRERLTSVLLDAGHHGRAGWDGRTMSHSSCGSLAPHHSAAVRRMS